ncbi:4'-phosphopantetheinyl transferase EntD [Rheinheimera pacifica]|uniref:4'-phosphopantetheinyl transferase family protein n=1 Tax=Rheinheimera pacifica TaxID=173990 RepID=UPI002169F7A7|nr:4'-phosphopantetheinyl transferase superfamily protein [Rheinheimera pacifica]MCS4307009.1 4'-phosphopantetheinyl transferase EntD [Rheinheimera pacifica]
MISEQQRCQDAIGTLIPVRFNTRPELLIASCQFDVSRYNDTLFKHYGITMPDSLLRAVPKRRCEYLAGRVLFQQLLQEHNQPAWPLLNTPAGAPLWPPGYTGSVSHSDGTAICCLCPTGVYQATGIDIETILSTKTGTDIEQLILQPAEQHLLRQLTAVTYTELLTIAFSAKESLYKALYPQVQRFFGFEDAAITNIKAETQQFTLCLTSPLGPQLSTDTEFHGHYSYVGQQVISLIALPA